MTRGNALIEVLVVGFAVALALFQVVVGVGRLQVAGDAAASAAQTAALWAARSGSAEDAERVAVELDPGAEVEAWQEGHRIFVVVSRSVSVVGPAGGPIRYTVVGRGSASMSPYRSDG